jgi:hypothetical protein
MKMSELKEKILMSCLDEGMIESCGIYCFYNKRAYLEQFISNMTKEGFFNNRKRTYTTQNKKFNTSYKAITNKGVQWLIDNCSDHYSWLKYLPNPICDFSIKVSTSSEGTNRFLKRKSASVIFSQVGIPTDTKEKNIYRHNSSENITLNELIEKAKQDEAQNKKHNGIIDIPDFDGLDDNLINYLNDNTDTAEYPLSEEYPDMFYVSTDILQYFKLTQKELHQYKFSSHIGVLVSRLKSYLIYHTTPRGIAISESSVNRAKQSVQKFINATKAAPEFLDCAEYAIIFCKNSREFETAFKDKYNQRRGRGLSKLFNCLYMFPICYDTIPILAKVLAYKDNFHKKICEILTEKDARFTESEDNICELNFNNYEACICVDMEVSKLEYLVQRAKQNPDNTYIAICLKWQEEYLKRIFTDNIQLLSVEI